MILHIALGIVLGFFLLHLVIWGGVAVIVGVVKLFGFMAEHPIFAIVSTLMFIGMVVNLLHG
jgi:hypothetical protein